MIGLLYALYGFQKSGGLHIDHSERSPDLQKPPHGPAATNEQSRVPELPLPEPPSSQRLHLGDWDG